jgi:ABC-type Fe3+/spermidine/putrescine transport system ATPase subunit
MILALDDIWLRRGETPVLRGFSLAVAAGEILALLGPSGCGKTTVLRVLLGLAAPERGVVRLGTEVASENGRIRLPPEGRGLGVVFQDLALWPHLTVRGNLAFGLEAKRVPRAERDRRIAALLDAVGLSALAQRYPGELSGGERQRVAIARALVLEPRAVLLDEPLSNLDVGLRRELLGLFRSLLRGRRTTALYVTHDVREAAALGDRIAVMAEGRVQQSGTLDELGARPASDFVRRALDDLDAP